MTDITELAQSLKATAIDAKELAIIARYSKGRAAAEKFYALANPNNVLALVEALEKAQQVDEELCKLLPPGAEYMDPPDGGDVTPLEGVRRMVADYRQRIDALESQLKAAENNEIDARFHIADLESRTVTINTPGARDEDYDWDGQTPSEAFNTCRMICALMFRQSLRAAGIKVEAE